MPHWPGAHRPAGLGTQGPAAGGGAASGAAVAVRVRVRAAWDNADVLAAAASVDGSVGQCGAWGVGTVGRPRGQETAGAGLGWHRGAYREGTGGAAAGGVSAAAAVYPGVAAGGGGLAAVAGGGSQRDLHGLGPAGGEVGGALPVVHGQPRDDPGSSRPQLGRSTQSIKFKAIRYKTRFHNSPLPAGERGARVPLTPDPSPPRGEGSCETA